MSHDDRPVVCPRCGAFLAGVERGCPNPAAHLTSDTAAVIPTRTYGAQMKRAYDLDNEGYVLIPFRRADGEVRLFRSMWEWVDPVSGKRVPFMFPEPTLDKEALLFVTGMGRASFEAASASFPGRIPGKHRVEVITSIFLREFLFGHVARTGRRWRRRTRRELKARHTATCPRGCRKRHTGS
jgi:hypothetical protein